MGPGERPDQLTHRNEIASCEEAAYNSLPVNDAITLLFFSNQHELMVFAQQVRANRIPSLVSPVPLLLYHRALY